MKKSRQTFSPDFKAKVAIEAIKEMKTISELAQIYQVHPNLISLWKKEFLSKARKVIDSRKDESGQIQKLKKENDDLVRQIMGQTNETSKGFTNRGTEDF